MKIRVRLGFVGLILALSGLLGFSQAILAREPAVPTGEPTMDFGDAPDSSNHMGVGMTAYASLGVMGDYPTVYDPSTGLPPGPSHIEPRPMFLGMNVSLEMEADVGSDMDTVNNLNPELDQADLDRADDAFETPIELENLGQCQPTEVVVIVTVNTLVVDAAYLNLWFDWNQNGKWGDAFECQEPDLPNNEWAVQNQVLILTGPGTYTFATNAFLPNVDAIQNMEEGVWTRVTLSEQPASDADGRGPDNRWRYGETEDHRIGHSIVVDPTNTPTPTPRVTNTPTPVDVTNTPTKTPVGEPTHTPTPSDPTIQKSDLGDAPDSTNNAGAIMNAYTAVQAKFPSVFAGPAPIGPLHHDISLFHLGGKVTAEREADIGPDQDPTNNILPANNAPNRDLADDGLIWPINASDYPHCQPVEIKYSVQYNGSVPMRVFFNTWADWNRNGEWGDRMDCPGLLVEEWAVQNEVLTLNPGLNTFTSVIVPWHSPNLPPQFWMRLSVSDTPANSPDGSGPPNGWEYGETEDYILRGQSDPTPTPTKEVTRTPTPTQMPSDNRPDLGDAPDSTNNFAAAMNAYIGVPAKFPSVFAGPAPIGPIHFRAREVHLGQQVTFEQEADNGPDTDGVNNLKPPSDIADQDRADDGLLSPLTLNGYPHCRYVKISYAVTNNTGAPVRMFVNSWADWTRNGAWGETMDCPTGEVAEEWIVQNQIITINPGTHIFSAPAFLAWHPANSITRPFWMRLTLSDTPATAADGSGPANGWERGETEDRLIRWEQIDPTPTPTSTPEPTKTPEPTATSVPPRDRPDLGDAPDSSNTIGSVMDAYAGVPARYPSVFSGPAPIGPMHQDSHIFHLGRRVSVELEADSGFDSDGFQNIDPSINLADQDRADDGLISPRSFLDMPACKPTIVRYSVTNNTSSPQVVHFNMWADWDRSGAWGGLSQCAIGPAREWAVQNQVITVPPGTSTFASPAFLPYHPFDRTASLWFRMTVSETPATADDGSGPANGWRLGETEDYYLAPDLGDAPDTFNHLGQRMLAYWFTYARFPTVYQRPTFLPHGPLHHNLGLDYMLGRGTTSEMEADLGPDQDIVNNLVASIHGGNRDKADDAFGGSAPLLNNFKHCKPQRLTYNVTVPSNLPAGSQAYVNVWIDWNRNGQWGGVRRCAFWPFFAFLSDEWAVKNQAITIGTPGTYTFTTPYFFPYQTNAIRPAWLRISLSDTPAVAPDGRGPAGGWAKGETEDHLLRAKLVIGSIEGTIKNPTGKVLGGSQVYLLQANVTDLSERYIGFTYANERGQYEFSNIPEGTYYVQARKPGHLVGFYSDPATPDMPAPIQVSDSALQGIDVVLKPRRANPFNIQARGSTSFDLPDENGAWFKTIFQPGQLGPIHVGWTGCLTCTLRTEAPATTNAPTGIGPVLAVRIPGTTTNLGTYPVQNSGDNWDSTIPEVDLQTFFQGGETMLEIYLLGSQQEHLLGTVELMTASGVVTDRATGQPIENAKVTLYNVPGWTARTSSGDDTLDSCESAASHEPGTPWSQPAPTEQGVVPNPHIMLFAPESAIQYTGTDGTFGWNVEPGCWYVQVEAPGYAPNVSSVVGLSTAVSDLNVELLAADHQIFLPIVTK